MNWDFFKSKFNSIKEKIETADLKGKCSMQYLKSKWKEFKETPHSIKKACTILSLYTIIVFNIPAFNIVFKNIKGGMMSHGFLQPQP